MKRSPMPARTSPLPRTRLPVVPVQRREVAPSRPRKPSRPPSDPLERLARQTVTQRSGGVCEAAGCWEAATDWSHRVARSQGGPWTASNGVHLCAAHHRACHAHPALAVAAGLHLRSWQSPWLEPAWIGPNQPGAVAGWWLLRDDGFLEPAPAGPRPVLPWEVTR